MGEELGDKTDNLNVYSSVAADSGRNLSRSRTNEDVTAMSECQYI